MRLAQSSVQRGQDGRNDGTAVADQAAVTIASILI
jgi:hypothetical protein